MSFIITTANQDTVVQVSETRITALADQSVISEAQRKTLIVRGKQAKFVLGWVGLATANNDHNTADWLFKTLYEMSAIELPIETIAANLRDQATAYFATLKALDTRCHFVMGGWQESEPFICTVSNFAVPDDPPDLILSDVRHHIPTFSEAAIAAPRFQDWIQRFRNMTDRHYIVNVVGDFNRAKLGRHFRGLESLLKKRANAHEISSTCRQVVLEASSQSKTVGRNVIGVEMDNTGHPFCSFYSEDGGNVVLVPDMLSSEGSYTQATIETVVSGDEVTTKIRAKIAKKAS